MEEKEVARGNGEVVIKANERKGIRGSAAGGGRVGEGAY